MKNNAKKEMKLKERMIKHGKKIMWSITFRGQYIIPGNASCILLDTVEFLNDKGIIKFKEHEDDVLVFGN